MFSWRTANFLAGISLKFNIHSDATSKNCTVHIVYCFICSLVQKEPSWNLLINTVKLWNWRYRCSKENNPSQGESEWKLCNTCQRCVLDIEEQILNVYFLMTYLQSLQIFLQLVVVTENTFLFSVLKKFDLHFEGTSSNSINQSSGSPEPFNCL